MMKILLVGMIAVAVLASTGPCSFTFNHMLNGRSYQLKGTCNIDPDDFTFKVVVKHALA